MQIDGVASPNSKQTVRIVSASITPASTGANQAAEQAIAVPGLNVGDSGWVAWSGSNAAGPTLTTAPLSFACRVAGTAQIRFANFTAGALTPSAGIYDFFVIS
jgi:hypothetical protein